MLKSASLLGKNIPLVEAAHYGGRQRPTAILIRTSWTTGDRGAANGIAQAWHNPNNQVDSCHYVVDEAQTIRCVPDKIQAFHMAGAYKGAISINVCHDPPMSPNEETMHRVVKLTSRLCKLYRIPIRVLNRSETERWLNRPWKYRGGIILKTVGEFPADNFFSSVKAA